MLSGDYLNQLNTEIQVNYLLASVSSHVFELKAKNKSADIKSECIKKLEKGRKNLPDKFRLSINNEIMGKGFNTKKFKIFSSKKMPLLIELNNSDAGAFSVRTIFKNGDDLRQDILTLQVISLMDQIWKENGLDLKLTPYSVLGTGFMQGYLEFVADSATIAEIQNEYSIFNTFNSNSIKNYMIKRFVDMLYGSSKSQVYNSIAEIQSNFTSSTAGYCVMSYVLGLGDRHPDNIMINKNTGKLFHIDFGHFLGNVKSKYGFKRERDPFVFTKEMATFIKADVKKLVKSVIGSKDFRVSLNDEGSNPKLTKSVSTDSASSRGTFSRGKNFNNLIE